MKVAICLSGLPRFWKLGYEFHYEHLIKEHNPDIFIHTWYDEHPREHDDVIKLYKPKKYSVDKNNEIKLKHDYPRRTSIQHGPYNIFSLYKSLKASNNLKRLYEIENDFRYDWVFRLRFDYALNRKFDLFNLDNNQIHFPSDLHERQLVTDQFAFSSSENMDIYSTVYDHLDEYYDNGEQMIGESMLVHHLKNNNLYDNRRYHDMNHPFYPGIAGSMNNSLIRKSLSIKDQNAIELIKNGKMY